MKSAVTAAGTVGNTWEWEYRILEVLQFVLEFHQTWRRSQTKLKLQPSSDILALFSFRQNIWKVEAAFLNGFLNLIQFLEGEWPGVAGISMVWECAVGCCVCHEEMDCLLVPLIPCVCPSLFLAPHPALAVPHPHSCCHLSHLLSFSCSARSSIMIPAFPLERKDEKAHPDTEQQGREPFCCFLGPR